MAKQPKPDSTTIDEPIDGAIELTQKVASSLKRLRKARGWSLDQLSVESGVSRAALSQIEGARTNPTLAVLWKIASGLDIPFHTLLGTSAPDHTRILRAEERYPLKTNDERVESWLVTPPGSEPGVEIYELRFMPKGELKSEAHTEHTTETVFVMSGTLNISVADENYTLNSGDSLFFHADVNHSYENPSGKEARCLNVIQYGRQS